MKILGRFIRELDLRECVVEDSLWDLGSREEQKSWKILLFLVDLLYSYLILSFYRSLEPFRRREESYRGDISNSLIYYKIINYIR